MRISPGRNFSEQENKSGARVVIINDTLKSRLFGESDPIGKQIFYGQISPTNPPVTIVGIVGTVRQATLDREPLTEAYFAYRQNSGAAGGLALLIKTRNEPERIVKTVQGMLKELDPAQPRFPRGRLNR